MDIITTTSANPPLVWKQKVFVALKVFFLNIYRNKII